MLPAILLAALPLVAAAPWAQPADSAVYELFKRQNATTTASNFPPVTQPPTVPDVKSIPEAWLNKLKAVESQIAKTPVSTPVQGGDGNAVTYPNGTTPDQLADKNGIICAFTTGCTRPDDIVNGPAGSFMITFDDGPGDGSQMLTDFLSQRNMTQHATHFMIGNSIIENPPLFKVVFQSGGHIASHTWSHSRMTTLTNEQIVGELGWTMQAISENTGGRLPLYWRPPYGDMDDRVRDVASKVFGLKAVLWNADSSDWKIATQGKNATIAEFDAWLKWDKSGKGINALMHEINTGTVEIFMDKFDGFLNSGWKVQSVAEAQGTGMYFNAADDTAPVTSMSIEDLGAKPPASAAPPAASGSAAASGASAAASGASASAAPSAPASGNASGGAKGLAAPLLTVLVASLAAALF